MSEHRAQLHWQRTSDDFRYNAYTRDHTWDFGHGVSVPASAAPAFRGTEALVDPEQAFVASLASCHMLTFLAICARRGIVVDRYEDHAVGTLARNEAKQLVLTRVELHPTISFSGQAPTDEELAELHEKSHHECFLANSVHTEVVVANADQRAST